MSHIPTIDAEQEIETVRETKCTRCRRTHSCFVFQSVPVCEQCLRLIVLEWNIKKPRIRRNEHIVINANNLIAELLRARKLYEASLLPCAPHRLVTGISMGWADAWMEMELITEKLDNLGCS